MRTLLLGADGQVGHRLRQTLTECGSLMLSSRSGGDFPCDLSNKKAILELLSNLKPEVIVNAAAYTAVDRAEMEEPSARAINVELPRHLGQWAASHNASILHYSTDYVFDGSAHTPYKENDQTAPLNVYGLTKLEGENALKNSGCSHVILRTAWVYDSIGQNFLQTMLRLAPAKHTLDIVDDQFGAPTSALLIAERSATILTRWLASDINPTLSGIYHLTTAGQTSWAAFAETIFAEAAKRGLCPSVPSVRKIPSSSYPTPARRPAWSVLDTSKVKQRFNIEIPHWHNELVRIFDLWPQHEDR